MLSPFEWWCRNFILPDICKPCLFVFLRNLFYLTLQAEYAALLAEKKEAYAELRKARDEAQELLIVKANVDRILQNTERGGNAQEKGTVSFAANCALY